MTPLIALCTLLYMLFVPEMLKVLLNYMVFGNRRTSSHLIH